MKLSLQNQAAPLRTTPALPFIPACHRHSPYVFYERSCPASAPGQAGGELAQTLPWHGRDLAGRWGRGDGEGAGQDPAPFASPPLGVGAEQQKYRAGGKKKKKRGKKKCFPVSWFAAGERNKARKGTAQSAKAAESRQDRETYLISSFAGMQVVDRHFVALGSRITSQILFVTRFP